MTKIKLCGLTRDTDILAANELRPDYVGFVFAKKSKRYVTDEKAKELKGLLSGGIKAVGVFVNEDIDTVARLYNDGIIDIAQLHGDEDEAYIMRLRQKAAIPVIKACKIKCRYDIKNITLPEGVTALLDAGSGDGMTFSWDWLSDAGFDYFLAGGLDAENVSEAVRRYRPYAVDVSSGIETDGVKDIKKMTEFVTAVRKEDANEQ